MLPTPQAVTDVEPADIHGPRTVYRWPSGESQTAIALTSVRAPAQEYELSGGVRSGKP
ncbi:hypothetical protein FB558_1078 [Pseudonocardia kunmingensis]|uniref:Uncharacterized protein n=1 Tax=Pseudonocardia kunmingensis TaxID=630975 RepID=A0A543DYC9_9PSEU|nr:hypothetical protein FB558_1078 [Pseudonocardia kunmingensis]